MNSTENQENNGQVINMKNSANGDSMAQNRDSNNKGNEDRKIFVGGIAYDVTSEDLTDHFKNFGDVANAQVKFDRNTGRSRGFAFVEFSTADGCKKALMQREQDIKGKQVEVKPAKSRENKKVFVGGLPADYPEDDLRNHFEQYGKVEDIEWPFDKVTKTRRNFAFIVFEEEESADHAAALSRQTFGTRECDVKKAVPQNKRFNAPTRGMGGMRTGYTNGMRGGAMIQNAGQWFGNNWGQMNAMPYHAGGAWNDWFNSPAYYQQNTAPTTGGYTNGYDYSQPPPTVRQQAVNGAPARYSQQF